LDKLDIPIFPFALLSFPGEKLVVTSRVGHVFKIGINRPHKRNCVSIATGEQLVKAFKEFEEDDDLWVAVFYGEGMCICFVVTFR